MAWQIAKRFDFSAAHRLDHLPDGHPCRAVHGHNYTVEIVLEADRLNDEYMVLDYHALAAFRAFIDLHLDHRNLNEAINDVVDGPPTAEVLARFLYEVAVEMFAELEEVRVAAVRVSETPKTWAEYRGC